MIITFVILSASVLLKMIAEKRQTILICVIACVFIEVESQKAIIFSSSIGYYNYRQTSNALAIYHKLKQYGLTDTDITLMIGENSGCCEKNPLFGSVSFLDHEYTPNLNTNLEIDFDYTFLTLETVFDILRVKYEPGTLNKVKLKTGYSKGEKEDLFVFVTGHGGDTYFKIREREAIVNEHFQKLYRDLYNTRLFNRILLLSDSCSAITPFETVDIENFTAFASSSEGQMSKSHGFDPLLNAPKSDDFTFYLYQYLEDKDPRKNKVTLKELFRYMSEEKLGVTAKIVGAGKKEIKQINSILTKKSKVQVKRFKFQESLKELYLQE